MFVRERFPHPYKKCLTDMGSHNPHPSGPSVLANTCTRISHMTSGHISQTQDRDVDQNRIVLKIKGQIDILKVYDPKTFYDQNDI